MCKGPEVGAFGVCLRNTTESKTAGEGKELMAERRLEAGWTVKGLAGQSKVLPGKSLQGFG